MFVWHKSAVSNDLPGTQPDFSDQGRARKPNLKHEVQSGCLIALLQVRILAALSLRVGQKRVTQVPNFRLVSDASPTPVRCHNRPG